MIYHQILVCLGVLGLVQAGTFCESHNEVHPSQVRTKNHKFPLILSHGSARTYTSDVLEFNWRWFTELKLGTEDVFTFFSEFDQCTNIVWGDTVLLLLSRTTSMEHLIGRTTIISDCSTEKIHQLCVDFLGDSKCNMAVNNCTVINAGKRPGSSDIGSVEICAKDLDEFFDRSVYNRTFDLLEMGVVVDQSANRPHLIDLTGRGKADFCAHLLSPPDITVAEWNSDALLRAAWPLLRRYELPVKREDFLSVPDTLEMAFKRIEYVCEYVINGIFHTPTCDWNGSTDLSVIRRQLHINNTVAIQLNRTLTLLEEQSLRPTLNSADVKEYHRRIVEFQASAAMEVVLLRSVLVYSIIAMCVVFHFQGFLMF